MYYIKNPSRIPAATAEPITPATFGPIACIRRKFVGSASAPTFWDTRAARDTCRVGYGRYTGITDQRINLVAFLQEEVENLHEDDTGCCGNDK